MDIIKEIIMELGKMLMRNHKLLANILHKELINKVLKSLKELFKDFLLEAL